MFRAILELSRISNIPTVWSNVLAPWWLAGGDLALSLPLLGLLVGASLIYTGGMWLNDAADANWDRQHKPGRVIPSTRLSLRSVWIAGSVMLIGGAAIMVDNGASPAWTCALGLAVLLYDVYHKPWSGSVIIMGSCRTLLWIAVASARGPIPRAAWIAGTLLGIYIIALTLMARAEGKGTLRPAARATLAALLLIPLIAPWLHSGAVALVPAMVLSGAFIALVLRSVQMLACGGAAVGQGVGWLLAGIPLVDALSVVAIQPGLALGLAAVVPVLRYWQRFVAAT
jgi:4-hydroxybenzoate polyprenyltransferase